MTAIPEFYMLTAARVGWPENINWLACNEYDLTETVSLYELIGLDADGYAVTWANNWYDGDGNRLEPRRIAPDASVAEQESILNEAMDDARASAEALRRRYGVA